MTLVMAWLNKADDATALYIASDSRFSHGCEHWDYGPKIYRLGATTDHLAYCGGIWLALSVILQGTAVLGNTNNLGANDGQKPVGIAARRSALCTLFDVPVKTFPPAWASDATLLYGGFDELTKQFRLFKLSLRNAGIQSNKVTLPKNGVACFGSGEPAAKNALKPGMKTKDIFKVLVDVIGDKSVPDVGGTPQMVRIEKGKKSHAIGFILDVNGTPTRTLFGLPLHFKSSMNKVEWRDKQFRLIR
jgi:hypothetical protein